MINDLDRYIELTKWIRELSSPDIEETENAETYRQDLLRSFNRIGELSHINQTILNENYYPLIFSEDAIMDETCDLLMNFRDLLIDPISLESVDFPLLYLQTEKLLHYAEKNNDTRVEILTLDTMVMVCYTILTATLRLYPSSDICFRFRDIGIDAAGRLINYLEPELFQSLDDECKEIVLINSRYVSGLFEYAPSEDSREKACEDIALLEKSLNLAYDAFYRDAAPNYDWNYHIVRTLQYITCYTEYREWRSFDLDLMKRVCDYSEKFIKELHIKCPELQDECTELTQKLYLARNNYLAKKISKDEYKEILRDIYRSSDINVSTSDDLYPIFSSVYEYSLLLDKNSLNDTDKEFLCDFYNNLGSYIYHLPKAVLLTTLLTFITYVINNYIEIDGAPTINDICLDLMASLHPPTYIHSLSVSELTVCLSKHLIDKEPERFIGILETENVEEVSSRKNELLDFIREASLLHDVGKIYVYESIMTYGRKLLDMEFDFIKTHPEVGANLLESHENTKAYADMARGHHKWYNDESGYPTGFRLQDSKYKTIISLLTVADCLDAATDTVGRNYKKSKTLDVFIEELMNERGTRYAPFAVDLMKDPDVYKEMEFILSNSVEENYKKTYELLKKL